MLLTSYLEKFSHLPRLFFIIVSVLGSVPGVLMADQVTDLYEVTVPVSSQDKEERSKAIQLAFTEVLVRVTGRTDIVQSTDYPSIQTAIETATRYAQQYRYRQLPAEQIPMTAPAAVKEAKANFTLWVRFDEAAVSRVLRTNNLPVWGVTRPATLVWMVVDEKGRRELIGNTSRHESLEILLAQAKRRGVPIRMPLLDLTDRTVIRESDVWGNFESTILQASQRYQTEAVLVGRIFKGYGGWNARWSLYSDSRRHDWTPTGVTLNDVIMPGIDATAESLAQRYAQVGESADGKVFIQVRDVKTLADYNRVVKYLKTISSVSGIQPYQVTAESTIFELATPAGRLGVARAVALGHTLATEPVETVPIPDTPATGTTTESAVTAKQIVPDLLYRLIP